MSTYYRRLLRDKFNECLEKNNITKDDLMRELNISCAEVKEMVKGNLSLYDIYRFCNKFKFEFVIGNTDDTKESIQFISSVLLSSTIPLSEEAQRMLSYASPSRPPLSGDAARQFLEDMANPKPHVPIQYDVEAAHEALKKLLNKENIDATIVDSKLSMEEAIRNSDREERRIEKERKDRQAKEDELFYKENPYCHD